MEEGNDGCGELPDIFDRPDEIVGADNPFTTRTTHTRHCTRNRRSGGGGGNVDEALWAIVRLNAPHMQLHKTNFAKRPPVRFCDCTAFAYEISLAHATVTCAGCGRGGLKSTRHTCKPPENTWLGKHQMPLHRKIRKQNFKAMAAKLPYALTDDVIESCNDSVPACTSVVFLDLV